MRWCCGSCSDANAAQPDATEWLWVWYKPIGYRQQVNFRPDRRRCEHRYRRRWLYLRRACALPMRYALLPHSSAGTASCRCWCAPIECGPSAACTGELVTRLMCLVCAGTVAATLERMAQPDATEWLYWFWCKPPVGYRQHGLGRELSQLQARSCRRCEHRYRRKWLYLRRACAAPMRYALPPHSGVAPASSCVGANGAAALVLMQAALSELMCLACAAVGAQFERTEPRPE